jgi:GR25 family glycosyltransferase involved in LPS biosynthesis
MENIFILVISLILIVILIIIFFKNKEDYDFKVYLISLDKDIKRRNNILKDIRVDDIYSVDGSKLDKNKLKEDNILSEKANIKTGEIGCYLSHVYFLKKCLKNNKISLIMEDDIDIPKYKLNEIQNIINKAPKNFQLYGSTDGTSWVLLVDKQNTTYNGLIYSHTDMSQYPLNTNKYYNHYGLVVNALLGNETVLSFDEFLIYGVESVAITTIKKSTTKMSISSQF